MDHSAAGSSRPIFPGSFGRGHRLIGAPSGQPHHLENSLGIAIERHRPLLIQMCPAGYCRDQTVQCARYSFAGQPGCRRRKAPAGEDRGFCGLSVCRSDRPICIVGGHNDAINRMRPFYQNCNSYSGKLTTNCANPCARLSSRRLALGTWPTMRPRNLTLKTVLCCGTVSTSATYPQLAAGRPNKKGRRAESPTPSPDLGLPRGDLRSGPTR